MKKSVKTKKTIRKTVKKRKKNEFSDALKAFMLVGVIVAISALISCAVIMVHSSINNESETALEENASNEPIQVLITEEPKTEQSANEQITPDQSTPSVTRSTSSRNTGRSAAATTPIESLPVSVSAITRTPDENMGTLVFVIDDAGNNLRDLEPFLQVPGPLTIAVLPGLPNSAEAARRIRAAGKEVILHQPMEAIGAQDPGPGAIYSGMSADEIRSILTRNITEVGPVTGMNNHQGSKITMDREIMRVILDFCAEHNIYFLDSRTTADSVVSSVARNIEMQVLERNVFIDNEQNRDAMFRYISGGLTRAQRTGNAIMIGHIWSPALAPLLTEQFPVLLEQGYSIKTASDIIKSR